MSNKDGTINVTVKKKSSFLKNLTIFILIIISLSCIVVFLALRDDNYGKFTANSSSKLIVDATISTIMGDDVVMTETDVNDYMAYVLENSKQLNKNNIIEAIYFDFEEEQQIAKVYIPILFYGVHMGISFDLDINYNSEKNRVDMFVSHARLGKVPLTSSFIANRIYSTLNDYVGIDGNNNIYIDSNIEFNLKGQVVSINIDDVHVYDNNMTVEVSGAPEVMRDYFYGKLVI